MNDSTNSMTNKICVVTGATSGIGLETAKALALMGANVIVVGRNAKKCIATVTELKKQTGNALIESMCADLSELSQVRNLARELKQKYPHIDVLVNNAGAYFKSGRYESTEGYEMTLALNYLSPFLLTSLLVDSLKKSDQGRIINVSSNAHFKGEIRLDDLQSQKDYDGFKAYAQSKLALVLFTYELARRLTNTRITVNALHPGLVATNFGKNNGLLRFYLRRLIKRHEISAEEGARTCIYLATSPDVDEITGGYFVEEKQVASSNDSYDQNLAKKLWEVSEILTNLVNSKAGERRN